MPVQAPASKTAKPAADHHDRPLSRRVLVSIRRDQTTETPRIVWAHEVPLLQVLFGQDEVREIAADALDEGYTPKVSADLMPFNKRQDAVLPPSVTSGVGHVFIGSPEVEYNRLATAYGRHAEVAQPNVEYVYGRYSRGDFARMLGRPTLDDLPDGQLRDLILSYGHYLPVATKDSPDAERAECAKAWADFRTMDRAGLVALAQNVGVEIGG
jgi:hypothetical protein